MRNRVKIFLGTAAIGSGLAIAFYFILPGGFVPSEFSEARIKGAGLAEKIVELSNESLANLEAIAKYDEQGNTPEALTLLSKEVIKNRETHEEAIRLSAQLEKMARSLSEIKPARARVLATEAVSSEVALVSRLLSYNNFLLQLFEVLRDKFQNPRSDANGRVEELIAKINEEARAINDFNRRFNQSLAEFDKLF
jgi:hypothetical protein